jgi:hypothetical protein
MTWLRFSMRSASTHLRHWSGHNANPAIANSINTNRAPRTGSNVRPVRSRHRIMQRSIRANRSRSAPVYETSENDQGAMASDH